MPSKLTFWKQLRGLMSAIPASAGVMPTANLGSGTANATTFLRGDQAYSTVSGAGHVLSDPAASGNTWVTSQASVTTSSNTLTSDVLFLIPFRIAEGRTFTQMALPCISGSGNVRCGIYSAHSTTNLPDALLVDAGAIVVAATTTVITSSFSLTLKPGLYYFAFVSDAGPSVRAGSIASAFPLLGVTSTGGTAVNILFLTRAMTYGALGVSESGNTYTVVSSTVPLGLIR